MLAGPSGTGGIDQTQQRFPMEGGPRHETMLRVTVAPSELEEIAESARSQVDQPWSCTVWDDPINLMSYVTYVFMTYFHYTRDRAERLMLTVHHEGRAAVSHGSREAMERDAAAMHSFGLWATVTREG